MKKKRWVPVWSSGRELAIDQICNIVGAALFSAGLMLFAKPAGFALGGLSGVALVINRFTGFPVGTAVLLLDVPLVFLSLRVLGRSFLVKSALSILIMTAINDLIFTRLPLYRGEPMLAALFCGALMGAGLGIIYSRGSSTGGTDFLVLPLHRVLPRFTLAQIAIAVDAIIILTAGLVYRDADAVLYGIVSSVVCTAMMDRVLYGARSEKMVFVITDHGMEVAKGISQATHRGATNVPAIGTYTQQKKDLLLCICSRREIVAVRHAAHTADPRALVMIAEVNEAFGEGFQNPGNESF